MARRRHAPAAARPPHTSRAARRAPDAARRTRPDRAARRPRRAASAPVRRAAPRNRVAIRATAASPSSAPRRSRRRSRRSDGVRPARASAPERTAAPNPSKAPRRVRRGWHGHALEFGGGKRRVIASRANRRARLRRSGLAQQRAQQGLREFPSAPAVLAGRRRRSPVDPPHDRFRPAQSAAVSGQPIGNGAPNIGWPSPASDAVTAAAFRRQAAPRSVAITSSCGVRSLASGARGAGPRCAAARDHRRCRATPPRSAHRFRRRRRRRRNAGPAWSRDGGGWPGGRPGTAARLRRPLAFREGAAEQRLLAGLVQVGPEAEAAGRPAARCSTRSAACASPVDVGLGVTGSGADRVQLEALAGEVLVDAALPRAPDRGCPAR